MRWGFLQGSVTLTKSIHPAPSLGSLASVQAWLKRCISVGISLRARSPDPAQLSSLKEPGALEPPLPQTPQAVQVVGARSHELHPIQAATAIRSQRRGWGRESLPPQAWLCQCVALTRVLCPCRTHASVCSLGPPVIHGWVSWRLQGGGRDPPLTSLCTGRPPLCLPLVEWSLIGSCLLVGGSYCPADQ